MKNTWFIADTHFDHEGIFEHIPERVAAFHDVFEMGTVFVDGINAYVRRGDRLIHLGDFCWQASRAGHWRQRLNVRELWICQGNHDASSLRRHVSRMELMIFFQNLHLSHYPLASWRKLEHGGLHLHGHSHGRMRSVPGRLDVGIDPIFRLTGEWRPIHLDEALELCR